ncbi:hypothetical protein BD289DRAFT_456183 [Coniella lustricola]|uniref:BRCT domain-containing protein n=1 Tax=Coniella lustricola TaxID=2025994 RepID=A0A2T2ZWT7_9PEZI|nr:hypothetical protein BD289DRAFT_456183 [Coniella lustricola]
MTPDAPGSQAEAAVLCTADGVESQDSQAFVSFMHRLHGMGATSNGPRELAEYNRAVLAQFQSPPPSSRARVRARVTPSAACRTAAATQNRDQESGKESRNTAVSVLLAADAGAGAGAGAVIRAGAADSQQRHHPNPDGAPEPATAATVQGLDRGLDSATATAYAANVNPPPLYSVRPPPPPPPPLPLPPPPVHKTNSTDASSSRVYAPTHTAAASAFHATQFDGLHSTRPDGASAHPLTTPIHVLARGPSHPPTAPAAQCLDSHGDADPAHQPSTSVREPHINATTGLARGGQPTMQYSESPTQSMGDRSYEQYVARGDDIVSDDPFLAALATQHILNDTTPSNNDGLTLSDDDTGAVNFHFSAVGRGDSQPSALGSGAPAFQDHSHTPASPRLPDTPAPARNPLSGLGAAPEALMASSQMFRHTQFSSAHKPMPSPTSSRPSPDHLHALDTISPNPSPLKRMNQRSSPPPNGAFSFSASDDAFPTSSSRAGDEEDEDDEVGPHAPDEQADTKSPQKGGRANGITKRSTTFHALPPRAPIESYEPHRRSLRHESAPAHSASEDGSEDDDSDVEYRRRQRVAQRRKAAAHNLRSIRFERHRTSDADDGAVVPSTNKDDAHTRHVQQDPDQCDGFSTRDSPKSIADTPHAIADSQSSPRQRRCSMGHATDAHLPADCIAELRDQHTSSVETTVPNTDPAASPSASAQAAQPDGQHAKQKGSSAGPVLEIPETSPVYSHPRPQRRPQSPSPVRLSLTEPVGLDEETGVTSASRVTHLQEKEGLASLRSHERDASESDIPVSVTTSPSEAVRSSPNTNFRSSPPVRASRIQEAAARQTTSPIPNHIASTSPPANSTTTSPLSRLSATPALSAPNDDETPLTEESPRAGRPSSLDIAQSSPAAAKVNRQKASKPLPNIIPNQTRASLRRIKKTYTPDSATSATSTDELALTPHTPLLYQTRRSPRGSKALSKDEAIPRETSRGTMIFTGMLFAVSFQARQPAEKDAHYKARLALSEQITNKIKQAGGKLVTDGFDKLFEVAPAKPAHRGGQTMSSTPDPDDDIELVPSAQEAGFTALIADGHSRKIKYMQALALGLPCIHQRWITACLDSHQLVDWSHYLLCAGSSAFLGDAIRSRNLVPYDASGAKLREVIQHRPRLLDNARILLVMPATHRDRGDGESSEKKEAYMFLARVLGASLSRVYTLDEAKAQLKAREEAGRPFDWVYQCCYIVCCPILSSPL